MPRTRRTGIVLASLVALLLGAATPAGAGAPRIMGGTPASLTAHPWQVAVFLWDGSSYGQACGGVILDATHVLTAAHCVLDDAGDPYADPTDVAVLAGVDDLAAEPLPDEQFIEAADLEPMSTYGSPVGDAHDAGLITLATPLTRTASVQPAALPGVDAQAPSVPAGTPLTVSGWGSLDAAGNVYDSVLRAVTVKAVPDQTCGPTFAPDFDAPTMLCAIDAGKDSCFGDSGGPLTMTDGLLVGLVSFGPDTCGGTDGPGVYTEIAEPSVNAFARFPGYTPPASTASPSVSGTPAVGTPIACDPGSWTGTPQLAYRFEQDVPERTVVRDWSADPAYTPQAADAGRALRCLVRARSDGGAAIARSAPTAPVPGGAPPFTLALTSTSLTPALGQAVTVTAAGRAAATSDLWWYAEPSGGGCAPTRDEEAARAGVITLGARYGLEGAFSRSLEFSGDQAVPYRLCAYLYGQSDSLAGGPRASAELTITPAAPVAPSPPASAAATTRPVPLTATLTAPRRQRLGRGVIQVRVRCSQACRMTASATVGRHRAKTVRRTRAATTATLKLKLAPSALRKLRRLLRTRRSVTATVTVVVRTATDQETARRTIRITR